MIVTYVQVSVVRLVLLPGGHLALLDHILLDKLAQALKLAVKKLCVGGQLLDFLLEGVILLEHRVAGKVRILGDEKLK